MATTRWVTDTEVRRYLLANGQMVDSPPMEKTISTRPRYRFVGETDSYGSNQIKPELISRVEALHGSTVAMDYRDPQQIRDQLFATELIGKADWAQAKAKVPDVAQLIPRDSANGTGDPLLLWSIFAHETLPYEALVRIKVQWWYGRMNIDVQTTVRSAHIVDRDHLAAMTVQSSHSNWSLPVNLKWGASNGWAVRQAVYNADVPIDDMPPWNNSDIPAGMRKVAELARVLLDREEIKVPYWSDVNETGPSGYLTLKQTESNISSEVLAQLSDLLGNESILRRLAHAHQELTKMLREAGIQVGRDFNEDELMTLLAGDVTAARILCHADDLTGVDRYHTVQMNLITGTLVVNCASEKSVPNQQTMSEAAQMWELARFQAEMTGQEDELLTFARQAAEQQRETRAVEIERKAEEARTATQG